MDDKKLKQIYPPHEPDRRGDYSTSESFDRIGLMEAVYGDVVLRGRNGDRDHIIPLTSAVSKYYDTMKAVKGYARNGVRGWDTLMDIAKDLKVRIFEAVEQRKKLGFEIPPNVATFVETEKKNW